MSEQKQIEEMAKCCIYHKDGLCVIDSEISYCDLMCKMFGFITNLYNAGYRKQSEWISVEERTPDKNTFVLVWCGNVAVCQHLIKNI